jgi:hypothetical protein
MIDASSSPIAPTLTLEECWSVTGGAVGGRPGSGTVNGSSRIIPVNYSVADDVIYFQTAPGTVLNNVTSQKVGFEVDAATDLETWAGWSVCIVGSGRTSLPGTLSCSHR